MSGSGPLYYCELPDGIEPGETLSLRGAEGHHAVDVRRLRSGEAVILGDGAGKTCRCRITTAERGSLSAEIVEILEEPVPRVRVTLQQALAKGGRDELAIQAATEAGVWAVRPWLARRSISRWEGRKVERGVERWRSVVREAAKQSLRSRIPEVLPLCAEPSGRLCGDDASLRLVLDPEADERLGQLSVSETGDITILVGPEGGIPEQDLVSLSEAGVRRVRLGETVLRTSTAGVAALAILNAKAGIW